MNWSSIKQRALRSGHLTIIHLWLLASIVTAVWVYGSVIREVSTPASQLTPSRSK